MKYFCRFTFIMLIIFNTHLYTQNSCAVFTDIQYSELSIVPAIQYAPVQVDFAGNNFIPTARLVKATENTCPFSPLLILAHGGGFTSGNALLMDSLSYKFAKLGYVCAAINYRLGWPGLNCPTDSTEAIRAWFRSLQDINNALSFFKSNFNEYQIDTNNIFLTGWSAGGYAAIGAAYTDLPDEIPSSCFDLGPITDVPTFPSFKAVATFSAAFLFPQHINNGQKPAVIMFNNSADAYQIPLECGKWWNYGNCENSFPQACGITSVLPILEQNDITSGQIIYNYQTSNPFNSHWLHNPAYFPYWEEETDSMAAFFQQFITSEITVGLNTILPHENNSILIPSFTEYTIPEKMNGKIFSINGNFVANVNQGFIKGLSPGIYFLQSNKTNIKIIVN
jgi:hypothetical protein